MTQRRIDLRASCVANKWMWVLLLLTTNSFALAHPPHLHRKREVVAQAGPTKSSSGVSELDRQVAYFQYEFLSDVARRCPLDIQSVVIQQLLDEHRFAVQLPEARELLSLEVSRQTLDKKLRERFIYLEATWDRDFLRAGGKIPLITVGSGLSRFVVVNLRNATEAALNLSAKSQNGSESPNPLTVLPGKSQPFLLELGAGQSEVTVDFAAAKVVRSLKLPIITAPMARLRGRLIDGDLSLSSAGRVWVEGSDRQLRRAGPFVDHRTFQEKPILELPSMRMAAVPFFYADGSFEIDLPPGKTTVTFERGFEHVLTSETVDLQPGETRDMTLISKRFVDAKTRGWISGDTHIHWVTNAWNVDLPLDDLAVVQRAEDLRVINNLTLLHRTPVDAFIKPSQAQVGPIAPFCNGDYHIEMAEEYRNQNLYGHLCFLNLQWLVLPIGTGPQIAGDDSLDYPLNKTAIIEARGQGGISIEAHGTGANHELPLNAVHGLTDSVDQIDVEDYYRLLDCGFQLPLTNGSDHPARIAGCARAYVQIEGEFDYEKWIDGIRCGRTFTTSGPLLFFTVNEAGPGTVLTHSGKASLTARLHAHSRFPLGRVQIVSNGKVMKEIETQDHEAVLECDIPADLSRWVVARCSRNDRWNALWHPDIAHTSAISIHRDGRPVFRDEAAHEWIDRMRLHTRDILTKGQFANASQRKEATAYVDESIRRYERLITTNHLPQRKPIWEHQRDRLLMQAAFASHVGHDPEFVKQISKSDNIGQLSIVARPLTLLRVHINPESRVKLAVVGPPERIVQHRTQRFLVEVHNEAGIQAPLRIQAFDQSQPQAETPTWFDVRIVQNLLSSSLLTGEELEWKLLELRCLETGHREIRLEADAGQGTQDLGFRATADLLLKCVPRSQFRTRMAPSPP